MMNPTQPNGLWIETSDAALTCQYVREHLEWIVPSATDGPAHDEAIHHLITHLAACPACWRAYEDLCWLLRVVEQRELSEPPFYPQPDLSFLSGCAAQEADEWPSDLACLAMGA
mgnify:CR=1 FL=1